MWLKAMMRIMLVALMAASLFGYAAALTDKVEQPSSLSMS